MGWLIENEACWDCGGKGWVRGYPIESRHHQGDYHGCLTCGGSGAGNSLRNIKKGSGKLEKKFIYNKN